MTDDEQEPHRQERDQGDQDRGVERADRRGGGLVGFLPHVDDEEGEQPDGEGQDEVHATATQRRRKGYQRRPRATGTMPT